MSILIKITIAIIMVFFIAYLIKLMIKYKKKQVNKTDDSNCFGKTGSTSYACPDTDGKIVRSVNIKNITVNFEKDVIKWNTPDKDFFSYVSPELTGPLMTVLLTDGYCCDDANCNSRPSGNFYNCGPMNAVTSKSPGYCGDSPCGNHSKAHYTKSKFDQGHMVTSKESGLFTEYPDNSPVGSGMQSSFSMCNIWPQGEDFNRHKWQHLEFTTSSYAVKTGCNCATLTGPIFNEGTDKCIFPGGEKRETKKCSSETSLLKVPSHFYKILIDFDKKKYWAFIAENHFEKQEQDVEDMLKSLDDINNMEGMFVRFDLSDFEEQNDFDELEIKQSAPSCEKFYFEYK